METKNKKSFGTQKLDDERRGRVLSPGMLVFKRFVRNKLAITASMADSENGWGGIYFTNISRNPTAEVIKTNSR